MLFKLTTPIKTPNSDKEITELELQEPTVELLEKLNYPYIIDNDGNLQFNAKKVYQWAKELSNLPPSTVKKISFHDMETFKNGLAVFFSSLKRAGCGDLEQVSNWLFNLAYSWHLDPFQLKKRSITDLLELGRQTDRIQEKIKQMRKER